MIDNLELLRVAADTGVVTLIWLVQLVIYPGLARYTTTNLKAWHPIYTRRVTFVVLPLMIAQLGLSIYSVVTVSGLWDMVHLGWVIFAWLITFLMAVPLHRRLQRDGDSTSVAVRLVDCNKWRVIAWSLTWLISFTALF